MKIQSQLSVLEKDNNTKPYQVYTIFLFHSCKKLLNAILTWILLLSHLQYYQMRYYVVYNCWKQKNSQILQINNLKDTSNTERSLYVSEIGELQPEMHHVLFTATTDRTSQCRLLQTLCRWLLRMVKDDPIWKSILFHHIFHKHMVSQKSQM